MRAIIIFAGLIALSVAAPQFGYNYPYQNSGSGQGGEKYLPPAATTPKTLIHKQFFSIAAPEDHSNDGKVKHLLLGRPQKNYRVVFIKAPQGDNDNVKYSAELAPQDEKTVIYVLSKKDNDLNIDDIATPPPTIPSKPEVYFIKYKTPEEAAAAQKEIQDQYDHLGGTNEYSDEGTAPITSVIGSLDGSTPDGGYDYRQIQGGGPGAESPISQYLPPTTAL